MKEILAWTFGSIGAVILLCLLGFIATGGNLLSYAYFAPKYQAIQRQVYTQSPSFILGNQGELEQQARAYRASTDPSAQAVIKAGMQTDVDNLGTGFPVPTDVNAILNQ